MARKTRAQVNTANAALFVNNSALRASSEKEFNENLNDSLQFLDPATTKAALEIVRAASGLTADQWYKITNATASNDKVIAIKASAVNAFYTNALNFTDATFGTYSGPSGDVFTGLSAGANFALSNLASVAINASLVAGTAGTLDLGATALPWRDIYLAGSSGTPATNRFLITGASTSGLRTITLPDLSGTVALLANAASFSSLISTTSLTLGVASSATGQIILRNSANARLVTLQAGATAAGGDLTYTWPITAPTAGQVLSSSAAGVLSWVTGGGGITIASTTITGGTTTRILYNNAGVVGEYTLTGTGTVVAMQTAPTFITSLTSPLIIGGTGTTSTLTYRTTSGVGAAGADHIFQVGNNGATEAMRILNSGNIGIGVSAPVARLQIAAGTVTVPQFALAASSAVTFIAGVNGYMYYDTVSSNSSISLYKDSAYTKLITAARNPDFATASTTGVIVADSNGTLSKSGDLTALGIFAQTSTITVANIATSTTLLGALTGSATLPASFFGTGKTIKIFVSGTYNQASGSQDCALKLTIGGVTAGTITFSHSGGLTAVYYDAEFTLTCRTTGASGTLQYLGVGRLLHTGTDLKNYVQVSTTSGAINTTVTLAIDVQADWVTADPDNSITASIITATYLN